MTRETKIGLLVGLAFIIVIGILLSDQLVRSTEPPAAPLSGVAEDVRRGAASPSSSAAPVGRQPPVVGEVMPENRVPVREEVAVRAPPVTFVEIRPGNSGTGIVVPGNGVQVAGGAPTSNVQNATSNIEPFDGLRAGNRTSNVEGGLSSGQAVELARARGLAEAAAAAGETLIGLDGQPLRANPLGGAQGGGGGVGARLPGQAPVPMATKQYKAEAGDNLSRMASRFFGSNTKATRDAIVRANPSLAADPNKIIVGQVYEIPVVDARNREATSGDAGERANASRAAAENWYTVKSGDSLWKIAVEQCGDKNMVAAIKELNRETVKDWDRLQANVKIRLPARAGSSGGASVRADR